MLNLIINKKDTRILKELLESTSIPVSFFILSKELPLDNKKVYVNLSYPKSRLLKSKLKKLSKEAFIYNYNNRFPKGAISKFIGTNINRSDGVYTIFKGSNITNIFKYHPRYLFCNIKIHNNKIIEIKGFNNSNLNEYFFQELWRLINA